MPTLVILFNTVLEDLTRATRQEEEMGHPNRKERSKTFFQFSDDVFFSDDVLYIENPKHSIKKLLELINKKVVSTYKTQDQNVKLCCISKD